MIPAIEAYNLAIKKLDFHPPELPDIVTYVETIAQVISDTYTDNITERIRSIRQATNAEYSISYILAFDDRILGISHTTLKVGDIQTYIEVRMSKEVKDRIDDIKIKHARYFYDSEFEVIIKMDVPLDHT